MSALSEQEESRLRKTFGSAEGDVPKLLRCYLQLRAALTTAQQRCSDLKLAMGDEAGWFDRYTAERAAHAETRHCLEHALRREQTARAELAKAEARVKEADRIASQLKGSFEEWPDNTSENDLLALDMGRILEALRG